MATLKNYALFVLLFFSGTACNIPQPRIEASAANAIRTETIQAPEEVVLPKIPAIDSAQRLEDDPPPAYQAPREEIVVLLEPTARERARTIYTSQIGVREATGKNDGKAVEMYLRSTGLGKGFSWCAAFVRWTFDSARVKTNITAWSPTAHNPDNLVWFQHSLKKEPLPADVFTLWYTSKKRIAHTGFIDRKINSTIVETVEGNTNEAGSREGDGVYKKKRSINSIYSISRWVRD